MINQETIDAVKAYQNDMGSSDSDIMFDAGDGRNPANKWTLKVNRFF